MTHFGSFGKKIIKQSKTSLIYEINKTFLHLKKNNSNILKIVINIKKEKITFVGIAGLFGGELMWMKFTVLTI